jgi:hypothetical protein
MPEDLEVGVKLVPDEQALEDVEDREIGVGAAGQGAGGGLSPSQQNQQQSAIAGGTKKALVGAGVVALLTKLKPISASLSAIFGVLGRAILPTIEVLAELFRPFVGFFNDFLDKPLETLTGEDGPDIREKIEEPNPVKRSPELFRTEGPFPVREGSVFEDLFEASGLIEDRNPNPEDPSVIDSLSQVIENITSGGAGSPDQSDEANKTEVTEEVESTKGEKTGAIK